MKKLLFLFSKLIPVKARIYLFFLYKQGYHLNFSSPKTLSEKIQRRKLTLGDFEASLADKYKVRRYVENIAGSDVLIPIVGVYDKLTYGILKTIPSDAVIKTTHGSGEKHIHFMTDDCNYSQVINKFELALKDSYVGSFFGETHYDLIERKVIIERKLDFRGESPPDYKFHILRNRNSTDWFLQVDFDRFSNHKRNYYDSDLNLLDLQVIYDRGDFDIPSLDDINKMAQLAIKLNGTMPYSRVDMYLVDGRVYFGEITLTPGSGFEKFSNRTFDKYYGSLWGES
ncbi:ATP-grasp fold amidoligase family protein [Vibrio splendidus]|uniref:ATP-grasp fold amidoligase family protein n=1 Tax=Vibrio splendidus TaxID=29497 RepID=UPI00076AD8ED|nr:ATP-grasp fold amidoligase family protein [Vibrio splendidus]